jgi:hypothetical protein
MASRNRRHSLFSRRTLSCLAGPALSQCDLARFRADRRKLPLFGGPRLLDLGISGVGILLEVDGKRYASGEIRRLYERSDYPLRRRAAI